VCCHPFLFGEDIAAAATARHGGNRVEALVASSGKLAALDEMLPRLRAGGHKVLIFSQFTMMLDMLEEFCEARGHTHLRLDGSTSLARRRYETALFNKSDGRHFVYLCSTRAGGLGINLQSADTVILADPDWNPTYDQQAQDRAHRLGQLRPVTVIRMCHANSVEEGILAVAARKAGLAAAVLAGLEAGADIEALDAANAASGADPATAAKLSFSELREIILAGAGAAEAPKPKPEPVAAKVTRGRSGGGSAGASGSGAGGAGPGVKSERGGGGVGGAGAQAEGAAALARAVEGSGNRGHYKWEGVDYTEIKATNDKLNIADYWVSQLGDRRRERVATVEMIDAGAGLGMQAVSRISIMEAKEAEDRDRREDHRNPNPLTLLPLNPEPRTLNPKSHTLNLASYDWNPKS
jgi:SWI/SNF-related matrix-associated actin-dependent regulator of chromatin subfamily A member 5